MQAVRSSIQGMRLNYLMYMKTLYNTLDAIIDIRHFMNRVVAIKL